MASAVGRSELPVDDRCFSPSRVGSVIREFAGRLIFLSVFVSKCPFIVSLNRLIFDYRQVHFCRHVFASKRKRNFVSGIDCFGLNECESFDVQFLLYIQN